MKTLREVELEMKIHDLEKELWQAKGKYEKITLGEHDAIPCELLKVREIPMVARVQIQKMGDQQYQIILRSELPNMPITYGYYLDTRILYTKRHLEQALLDMHERLIHSIARERFKEFSG